MPDPEVVVRAKRRQYSAEYKKRILAEADSAKAPGAMGAMLRREGLYSSHLTHWRQQRDRGLAPCQQIGVKISYAELRLVGEDCWPASGILMNCAGDRDSPRFVSIAKRPCLGRRRVAPTASYEIETRRYADT